mmetsp:Transcript_108205/g.304886  ORF Transcript_108205/g.304886 Transcript_108205/m.304886 type:complete len:211 (+) Transcript_108205:113-745(+)
MEGRCPPISGITSLLIARPGPRLSSEFTLIALRCRVRRMQYKPVQRPRMQLRLLRHLSQPRHCFLRLIWLRQMLLLPPLLLRLLLVLPLHLLPQGFLHLPRLWLRLLRFSSLLLPRLHLLPQDILLLKRFLLHFLYQLLPQLWLRLLPLLILRVSDDCAFRHTGRIKHAARHLGPGRGVAATSIWAQNGLPRAQRSGVIVTACAAGDTAT